MEQSLEEKFSELLLHHLSGWRSKVVEDFGRSNFEKELSNLSGDSVYSSFGLNNPMYVLIRLMGRMSISIGRRLGEIYDKVPRFVVQARYGLEKDDVAFKMDGRLELDICIREPLLSKQDKDYIHGVCRKFFTDFVPMKGVGIEIRYNFNPNDSSRLRKDVEMGRLLLQDGLYPIYLVFSSISPRDEAIARLKRGGWHFLIGDTALAFMRAVCDEDFDQLLSKDSIRQKIEQEVQGLSNDIISSYAFKKISEGSSTQKKP